MDHKAHIHQWETIGAKIRMIQAVRAIVHENASVDEAYEIYSNGPVGL